MITYKNLTFIGTSHISAQSISEVKEVITDKKPEIIALELDQNRFISLIKEHKQKPSLKDMFRLGFTPFVISTFGSYMQRKLGDLVGVKPGSEMLQAIQLAKENNIKLALIDQDIQITMHKLSKNFTFREKLRFLFDIIKSPFSKEKIKIDLTKVPEDKLIKMVIQRIKKRYPSIYETLIGERNKIMARNLYHIKKENLNSQIVVIVGAGHLPEMVDYLKEHDKKPI